jgi:hypothetical protein
MTDLGQEIELLEQCATECALISDLATDRRARYENQKLALEYRKIADTLRPLLSPIPRIR